MKKVLLILLTAVVLTIAAARFAYGIRVDSGVEPGNEAWAHGKMEFVAWNQERWTAWIRENTFEQLPQNTRKWSRHSNSSIAFIDWEGEPWQARIEGDHFLLAHRGNWQEPVEQSDAIRYLDWSGNKQLRTVSDIRR